MSSHLTGTREQHLAARLALLEDEKELTRCSDALARRRRDLPWVPVTKRYRFQTPGGEATLHDLFHGRSQLLVYHFMMGPEWTEGCPACSFWADGFDGVAVHLAHRDVTLTCVSRAPLDRIDAYKSRMRWSFDWVSSSGSDFNFAHGVSYTSDEIAAGATHNFTGAAHGEEHAGLSAFALVDGTVHHVYSCYAAGSRRSTSATSCWIARRAGETRTPSPCRPGGCGATTLTRMRARPAGPRSPPPSRPAA